MDDEFRTHYLSESLASFRNLKSQAERALDQVTDEEFFRRIDPESNCLGQIVKHIAGNLRSRWTDFLTTDGEKPDRRRDTEFEIGKADTRLSVMAFWERGWKTLFEAISALTPDDLDRKVDIRGRPHTIVEAISRQLSHYAAHVGQILFLAKHLRGANWRTLSVPRGKSEEFNAKMLRKAADRRRIGS